MKFPILYSLTSHGQTQTWQIQVVANKFRTIEGLLDGVLTTSDWTECEGKNLGKTNETTGSEQAAKEAQSRYDKKLKSGYHETVAAINKPKFFEPMLAKKWEDYEEDIEYPVYSQPKLDGMRCVATKDGLFSRNGKPIVSAPHIYESLRPLWDARPELILDGELYNHDLKDDFNEVMSLAKQTKPTEQDLADSAAMLEYWVYDLFDSLQPKLTCVERADLLSSIRFDKAVKVTLAICEDKKTLDYLYKRYLEDGYEGQIIRADTPYENKRTKNLLKRKTFIDEEFELVNLESGRGNSANHVARAILKTATGVEFEAGIIGGHEYCAAILRDKNQYIGKMTTVVYQNMTPGDNPVPRFGKLKQLDRTDA